MTDMSTGDDASCYTNMYSNINPNTNAKNDVVSEASSQLLYGLADLKERVNHLRSLLSPNSSAAIDAMHVAVQDLIATASSILLLPSMTGQITVVSSRGQLGQGLMYPCSTSVNDHQTMLDWQFGQDQTYNNFTNNLTTNNHYKTVNTVSPAKSSSGKYDIVELDASDLLAKYTHYCHVCGKGFKRDANLRMHMRAHGDEYKTSAALSNPAKKTVIEDEETGRFWRAKKYSCPQEGCKWNQRHAKFQPLKSMICVKNHYKRSHCPKMYVCKRCSRKQFSVLSDLRTHEKHCGDLKWQCSCGTTFSRKDKLMGHVTLFVGHSPAVLSSSSNVKIAKVETQFFVAESVSYDSMRSSAVNPFLS